MSKFLHQKFLTKRLLVDYFSFLVMDIDGGYPRTKRILFLVPSVGRRPSLLGQISGNLRGARIAVVFRAEKRSAQAFAHPLSQAQGGLFCVLTACVDCVRQFVCLSLREF